MAKTSKSLLYRCPKVVEEGKRLGGDRTKVLGLYSTSHLALFVCAQQTSARDQGVTATALFGAQTLPGYITWPPFPDVPRPSLPSSTTIPWWKGDFEIFLCDAARLRAGWAVPNTAQAGVHCLSGFRPLPSSRATSQRYIHTIIIFVHLLDPMCVIVAVFSIK